MFRRLLIPHQTAVKFCSRTPINVRTLSSNPFTSVKPNDNVKASDAGEFDNTLTKSKVPLSNLVGLLKPYPGHIALCTTAVIASSMASMAIPNLFGEVIDILASVASAAPAPQDASGIDGMSVQALASTQSPSLPSTDAWNSIAQHAQLYVGVSVIGAIGFFTKTASLQILGERVGRTLREELYANMLRQDLAFFDRSRSGELANRLSTDVHEVAEHLVENAAILLNSGVTAIAASGFLIYTSPKLAAISLSIVPVLSYFAIRYSGEMKSLSKAHLNSLAQATQMASERFGAMQLVKFYNSETTEVKRYTKKIQSSYEFARKFAILEGSYVGVMFLLSNFTLLAVVGMGSSMILEGSLTVGSLAAFCMYANMLGSSTTEITEGVAGVVRAQGAGARLFELRAKSPELPVGSLAPTVACKGKVEFNNIHFAYPTRPEHEVLKGLSLNINPGETVCISGTSGCGKSTLSFLLGHLYEPSSGVVKLDGVDVQKLNPSYLRSQIATVSQDPLMLAGTIWDNVTYGVGSGHSHVMDFDTNTFAESSSTLDNQLSLPSNQDPQLTQWVRHCADVSHASEFIDRLELGYNTIVGEHGVTLSGGQMQRLSLCRALVSRPKVLVLDEATSALDIENELAVQRSIQIEMKNKTCIVISHHLQVMKAADKVAILEDGKVSAFGTFDELEKLHHPLLKILTKRR